MKEIPFESGAILVVDKPLNWTSFDVVKKIRFAICKQFNLKKIKVGHAGTLDPLASGLVVICTGTKTKKIDQLINESKEYVGEIRLGSTTPSFDLETKIDKEFPLPKLDDNILKNISNYFSGEILQIPPIFSAKRINGKRAYQYARNNEEVVLKPNNVTIYNLKLKVVDKNTLSFNCHCSKGTYIRSLARDIGFFLDSGGHLISLKRIKSGNFSIEMAKSIDQWIDIIKSS
jgi:tRNA pseudouridine55 synthase